MKILLTAINAKYIHSNPAVYSLRAYAADYQDSIEIAEYTINHYADDILADIFRRQPDVAAFSCYIWNLTMVEQVLEELHKVLPETEIWVGGPEVTYDAQAFLQKHSCVRGVMVGEGEETFRELAACYHGQGTLGEIRGLTFRREDGSICVTGPRALLDMNQIPFLYRDLTEFENRIIYYESSRGCPFSCSYCLSSIDKSVRFRDARTVVKELQFFLDRRVAQVKFVDRTFNCSHRHAQAIWTYIREHDNGVTNFHFEIAADLLNEEELRLLHTMRPGLVQLEIGVQSTNEQTIREIDRVMDFSHLSTVVRRIQAGENIHQHLDLIAGLPWEDYESFRHSFNDVYHLYPDQLQLGFLKVLKGSRMQQMAASYGIVYHSEPVYEVLYTDWLSYGELLKLKALEEMLEVYYNSGQFAHTMRQLEQEFEDPFTMYRELAVFYERTDRSTISWSRMQRFEILREFIRSVSTDGIYDELLLLDLYLRENSKSRPTWAPDLSTEKEVLLKRYGQEEKERLLLPDYEGYSAKQMMHMTHAEKFSRQVREICGLQPDGDYVLFDYKHRNPLSMDARLVDFRETLQRFHK